MSQTDGSLFPVSLSRLLPTEGVSHSVGFPLRNNLHETITKTKMGQLHHTGEPKTSQHVTSMTIHCSHRNTEGLSHLCSIQLPSHQKKPDLPLHWSEFLPPRQLRTLCQPRTSSLVAHRADPTLSLSGCHADTTPESVEISAYPAQNTLEPRCFAHEAHALIDGSGSPYMPPQDQKTTHPRLIVTPRIPNATPPTLVQI